MNFDDMKKIWNEESQQVQFVIDERLLGENIKQKKHKGSRMVSKMEWAIILSNLLTGGAIIAKNFAKPPMGIFAIAMGVLMVGTAVYVFVKRHHRLKCENKFDRTMLGDLDHAIRNANYRARLSASMLAYFVLVSLLMLGNAISTGKTIWQLAAIAVFCIAVLFLGRWEHRSWHLANKRRLEELRSHLTEAR
ncbi:MAG: hypothetical protein M9954_06545 [Cyclobacteriaceae bacterium]|nr:hypothetical protein [Cyclobacteriaceae bacterium]MCB0499812.1 hypothetical protein [Cyclobacteriaceae bacterium]MCB9239104.1 hypothetical protein [Flammeovirgaceae bacterium]MCO5271300.1 hypothetical protein [Cyclobacteriaceae bacterium]